MKVIGIALSLITILHAFSAVPRSSAALLPSLKKPSRLSITTCTLAAQASMIAFKFPTPATSIWTSVPFSPKWANTSWPCSMPWRLWSWSRMSSLTRAVSKEDLAELAAIHPLIKPFRMTAVWARNPKTVWSFCALHTTTLRSSRSSSNSTRLV